MKNRNDAQVKGEHGGARAGAGKPPKDGTMTAFKLASDVVEILETNSAGKKRGEKTRIVEEAVREWAKRKIE